MEFQSERTVRCTLRGTTSALPVRRGRSSDRWVKQMNQTGQADHTKQPDKANQPDQAKQVTR